ncbi:hypothetical protein KDA00_05855, partial [Candidatus Saccharibacteria bacterium]|nr:hypothetical protein [Candidatus Saccharibacteria bacterium]
MKAYITSIGEPTTELSKWSLERLGFDVEVIENQTSLAEKLKYIYNTVTDDFLRVDADVIVNKNVLELVKTPIYWWVQGQNFDWYKQDIGNGGVQFIRKKAIPYLKANIDTFMTAERPESQMFRIDEFNNPRKC